MNPTFELVAVAVLLPVLEFLLAVEDVDGHVARHVPFAGVDSEPAEATG